MSTTPDNPPAFPQPAEIDMKGAEGMTLRDYFAGQALAGLCANPGGPFQANPASGWGLTNCDTDDIAKLAWELADDVLATRTGKEGA